LKICATKNPRGPRRFREILTDLNVCAALVAASPRCDPFSEAPRPVLPQQRRIQKAGFALLTGLANGLASALMCVRLAGIRLIRALTRRGYDPGYDPAP
jgi:hypothetical protein